MRNPCGKTRDRNNPYETWEGKGPKENWKWLVLKKYQTPEKEADNPFSRWFCFVTSPFCPDGEYGDVYASEIKQNASLISSDETVSWNPKTQ